MRRIVLWWPGVLMAIALLSVEGCSFHSTQYEFVKTLVSTKEQSGPKKNWTIEWNGLTTPVFAVNGAASVFFVDEFGVQLKYQDSQITGVKGLLPEEEGKEIAVAVTLFGGGVKLDYRFLGESTSELHSCSFWIPPTETTREDSNVSIWVQNCVYLNFKYQNRRWLNKMGQLVRLEYLLKRGYPPANIYIL